MITNNKLTMAQVQADLYSAEDAIKRADALSPAKAKYVKGVAGYHLQQASEKLIKIQLYASGKALNNSRIYKHSLDDLILYGKSLGLTFSVPSYVNKNKSVISDWEAQGRYDVHFVVRLDQLKKCYAEVMAWYNDLFKAGYR